MAPESSITVTVNSRKAVSGKIIRTISMLVILLVIAFPFVADYFFFKHEKTLSHFRLEYLQIAIP